MNELMSFEEGYEQAIERTRQHFYALHSQIRNDLMAVMVEIEATTLLMNQHNVELVKSEKPANKKPASRDMKETYRRICNLCHPDKTGKNDETLTRLMHEAKTALKDRDEELLDHIYAQVLFYNAEPEAYKSIHAKVLYEEERTTNPWFAVHEHHLRGETRDAFFKSRKILGDILVVRMNERDQLKQAARLMGVV